MKAYILDMTGSVTKMERIYGKEYISNHKERDDLIFAFDDFTFTALSLKELLNVEELPQRTKVLDNPEQECAKEARTKVDQLVLVTDGYLEPEDLALFDEVINVTELNIGC